MAEKFDVKLVEEMKYYTPAGVQAELLDRGLPESVPA
jgi:predicted TPR repeat methyltransferase